ncbi:hypothetical protein DDB_G0282329 [Dictyostelium discoideum AX4]|uniref:Endonuclease/exonuclease/phosphatase domain-containing protein n=1 Tax=Dictyostelium discoideum TaxID=44689 RepID=Q54SN9_DICDI|nr:hypothetical protein DDB_G0282329 [Dictyostelium discoideum AX4]EAL66286.1 hypothetical protein DDB_G0282329 [Dictyostelium discoideum AX4]|eukprot:XP_640262.1 hypothetical protein DDB_G0282329 [Dictyostelium discoideum AX4]
MDSARVTVGSLNAGIQGGKPLKNTFKNQIKDELLLNNFNKNDILCLQEIDRDFQDFENYGNLKNKTVIEEFEAKSGTRLHIVSFKHKDVYFVVINCHIPQKKSQNSASENFFILERLVSKLIEKNIPFLIAGDINHNRTQIKEKLGNEISFANDKDIETTTGRNSIDNIMYSSNSKSLGFKVLKNATTSSEEAKINHYAIRSTFKLTKGTKLYKGDIQRLYDLCYNQWNHPTQHINIVEEKSRKKQNGKQDIIKIEIPIPERCSKVKSKFKKKNNKKWSAKKFHRKYFANVECCYATLLKFFRSETNNSNCKTALCNYLK